LPKLLAILIAAAMLFAPFAMQSGAAMAAMASDHHAKMVDKGHCDRQPAGDEDSKRADKPCCAAMCAAVAVTPIAPVEPIAHASSVDRPTAAQFQRGFLAKLPTPPPRVA
jgi:Ni/Co efflux regulator RcnB